MKTKTSSKRAISPFTIGGLSLLLLGLILIFNIPINFPPLEGFYYDDSDDVVMVTTEAFQSNFGAMVITSRNELGALDDGYLINNSINLDHPDFVEMHILGDYVGNAPKTFDLQDWSGYIRSANKDLLAQMEKVTSGESDIIGLLGLKNIVSLQIGRLLSSFDGSEVPNEILPQLISAERVIREVDRVLSKEKSKRKAEEE